MIKIIISNKFEGGKEIKKIILLILVALFSFLKISFAAGINGAQTHGKNKVSIGLEQEFVFDRNLERDPWSYSRVWYVPAAPVTGRLIFEFNPTASEINKLYRTLLKLSYGLLDNLDIYVKLGTSDTQIRQNYDGLVVGIPWGGGMNYRTEGPNFVYGGGLKATYDLAKGWFVGCDAQYLTSKSDYYLSNIAHVQIPGLVPLDSVESYRGELVFQEWHIAPYLAKKIGKFSPYLGLRYSDLHITDQPRSGLYSSLVSVPLGLVGGLYREEDTYYKTKLKAEDNLGIFFGTDYKITKNLSLNVEAHLLDEYALKFGGTLKF